MVKEIQRTLEEAHALDPAPIPMEEAASSLYNNGFISPNTVVVLGDHSAAAHHVEAEVDWLLLLEPRQEGHLLWHRKS